MRIVKMELDQFMKEFAVNFIEYVIQLFFPCLARRLDFAREKDLNKQLYTDSPQGAERFVDVLLEVGVKDPPPEVVLVHSESQQSKRFDFPARMQEATDAAKETAYGWVITVSFTPGKSKENVKIPFPYRSLRRGKRKNVFCPSFFATIQFKMASPKRNVRLVCQKAT